MIKYKYIGLFDSYLQAEMGYKKWHKNNKKLVRRLQRRRLKYGENNRSE
jgi:hypothetical protein